MRGKGRQDLYELRGGIFGYLSLFYAGIGKDHHLRNGSVELEVLDIVPDFFNGEMEFFQDLRIFLSAGDIFSVGKKFKNPAEKPKYPFDSGISPGLDHIERPHEHFIQAHGISAVFPDHIIGIDNILQ